MPLTLYLIFFIVLLLLILIFILFKLRSLQRENSALQAELANEEKQFSSLAAYNQKEQQLKERGKAKILALFAAKAQITNHDVARALKLSSATAFRYLDELEHDNKIKQNGRWGQKVFYSKK